MYIYTYVYVDILKATKASNHNVHNATILDHILTLENGLLRILIFLFKKID